MSATDWVQIAADTKLNEILERYSSVGPILVQAGRGWVNKPGDLYAQFPDLTVAQDDEPNSLEVGRRLRRPRPPVPGPARGAVRRAQQPGGRPSAEAPAGRRGGGGEDEEGRRGPGRP